MPNTPYRPRNTRIGSVVQCSLKASNTPSCPAWGCTLRSRRMNQSSPPNHRFRPRKSNHAPAATTTIQRASPARRVCTSTEVAVRAMTRGRYQSVSSAKGSDGLAAAQSPHALRGRRVRAPQVGELDLATAQRVDDVRLRLRGVDVHRALLHVRIDLLECAGERLAVVQQVRTAGVGLELSAP